MPEAADPVLARILSKLTFNCPRQVVHSGSIAERLKPAVISGFADWLEQHAPTVLNEGEADRCRKMALSATGRTEHENIVSTNVQYVLWLLWGGKATVSC